MLSRHPSGTQITHTDTPSANVNITAATQITHTDTSSAYTNITATAQIAHTDTSSANTNITAAPQITRTDTSSADTNIIAAPQIAHTDTSSANTKIGGAPQITLTDTSSTNTNITAATQITHTDRSSANANINCGDKDSTWHAFGTPPDALATVESLTALTQTVANGCERLRTVADGCGRLRLQTQNLANTASPPDPQVKREPSLRIREQLEAFSNSTLVVFWLFLLPFWDALPAAIRTASAWGNSKRPAGSAVGPASPSEFRPWLSVVATTWLPRSRKVQSRTAYANVIIL